MKKKQKNRADHRKVLALILAFLMVVTSTPLEGIVLTDIFAAEEELDASEIPVSKEDAVVAENTKDSTTFDIGEGKKKVVYYGSDVRYEDEDGKLVEYDPSLTEVQKDISGNGNDLSGYAYENTAGDKKQYLPQTLSEETPVLMEHGAYEIRMVPLFGSENAKENASAQTWNDHPDSGEPLQWG